MPNDDDQDKKRARAARAAAELKQTEDLLAGFDRPGRTPRPPPVRDFVDYHLNKKDRSDPSPKNDKARGGAAPPNVIAGPNASPFADLKRADPTFVIVKKSYPAWLPWAALLLAMPAAGGLVAYCTLGEDNATTNGVSVSSPLPSAATTISSAPSPPSSSPSIVAPSPAEQNVPPVELAPSTTPSPSSPPWPPASSSSPRNNSPAPSGSPDARVDFIRNL